MTHYVFFNLPASAGWLRLYVIPRASWRGSQFNYLSVWRKNDLWGPWMQLWQRDADYSNWSLVFRLERYEYTKKPSLVRIFQFKSRLFCFVLFCFALLCFCSVLFFVFLLLCFVLLCFDFALFVFALFCFLFFYCFALFCFALLLLCLFCFVLFCFVLFCFVLFCFVLFCFAWFLICQASILAHFSSTNCMIWGVLHACSTNDVAQVSP